MTEHLVGGVAVENTLYHFDKLYDYIIPENCRDHAQTGCRVMVNFGGSLRQGIIMELHETEDISKLKTISELLDKEPVLSKELVKLAFMMKDRCFCTLFGACRAMLPTGLSLRVMYSYTANELSQQEIDSLSEIEKQVYFYLKSRKIPVRHDRLLKAMGLSQGDIFTEMYKKNILSRSETVKKRLQDITVKMVHLENDSEDINYTPQQTEVINILRMSDVSRKEILYFTGVSGGVVDNLVKKGICSYYDDKPPEIPESEIPVTDDRDIILTEKQQAVYHSFIEKYESPKPCASLLYGITGSGKTSVFMKLIDRANADGKGVICMVPEIALTPQLLAKFKARYGNKVAVFHSGLSLSERLAEWRKVKEKKANIAVGTRSAVFAPLENIGLIVIDEEQEYTYKSSSSPRFHARELAKIRCVENNALLLMCSATPSIESYYFASKGRYSLETLDERFGNAKLPDVITVDMNKEENAGNFSGYSSVLLNEIQYNLNNGQQSIILLNRRGYNTFVMCMNCREVIKCPNCSISLTYHSANKRLMCHYCGYSIIPPKECPSCKSDMLRYAGAGTQKAESDLQELFPRAKIIRLDTDSTMQKFAYEKKLQAFQNGEYDIMLGTQMVAKGLDFPNVTLVGVLSADLMLHSDDFRSYERTFSLLTQVAGRSGRGDLHGRAVIQTYEPENSVIELASQQNYTEFYKDEILMRKAMLYPPFTDIGIVAFIGRDMEKTRLASQSFADSLAKLAKAEYSDLPMRVLGPSPALVSKINNKYRYRLTIRFKNTRQFREMLSRLLADFGKNRQFSDITAYADIDPENSN